MLKQEPGDDKVDARPDQAAMDAAIADFTTSKFRIGEAIMI